MFHPSDRVHRDVPEGTPYGYSAPGEDRVTYGRYIQRMFPA